MAPSEAARTMSRNRRRQFLFAALAVPASALFRAIASAQGRRVRIGVLNSASRPDTGRGYYDVLLKELASNGWGEGRNMAIDWRYADGDLGRHAGLAAELVALRPDLIIAGTQPAAVAAMRATTTIPIVFVQAPDPVESGLADSLARPGRNVTGFASMNNQLVVKRLELLHEVLPKSRRIAVLYQPDFDLNVRQLAQVEQAARLRDLEVLRVQIGMPQSYDAAFEKLVRGRPDGVLVIENPSVYTHRADIVRRMAGARLAAVYGLQDFSLAGGLLSYSISFADQYRRAADYVVRILRGAKPGELPIQQPVKFDLTVNLKAARALGLTVPPSILLRADRVIE
jgi:putative ABC transport system substrate-binding protein